MSEVVKTDMALEKVILPIVEGLGYLFVGLQYFQQGRHSMIRVYIDKEGGVNAEDCERVSRQVDAALEVEAPVRGEYLLEVSSPGLDRLLFTPEQFSGYLGKQVAVRLSVPRDGQKNFKGWIQSVDGEDISIRVEERILTLPFADIAEARLIPEW